MNGLVTQSPRGGAGWEAFFKRAIVLLGLSFIEFHKLFYSLLSKFAGIEMKVELDEGNVSVEADL